MKNIVIHFILFSEKIDWFMLLTLSTFDIANWWNYYHHKRNFAEHNEHFLLVQ